MDAKAQANAAIAETFLKKLGVPMMLSSVSDSSVETTQRSREVLIAESSLKKRTARRLWSVKPVGASRGNAEIGGP